MITPSLVSLPLSTVDRCTAWNEKREGGGATEKWLRMEAMRWRNSTKRKRYRKDEKTQREREREGGRGEGEEGDVHAQETRK
jgi:hypothetical protein